MEQYFRQINQQLQTPFPNTASRRKGIFNVFGVGLFVSLFLYYFFGATFEQQGYSALFLSLQFGLLTILGALLYEGFVAHILKLDTSKESWTFLHWLIYMMGLLLLLANINYTLFLFHTQFPFELAGFWEITQHTLAVGILPVVFSGYISKIKADKGKPAAMATDSVSSLVLYAKNHKPQLHLSPADILYVEALENYVYVYYIKEEKVEKVLLRNTLKSIAQQLSHTSTIRCHRSFMVNTSKIIQLSGNAQGLKLNVSGGVSKEIPVSRKYIPLIKSKTAALSFITKA